MLYQVSGVMRYRWSTFPAFVACLLVTGAAAAAPKDRSDAELHAEALADIQAGRFYNRPGATLEDYLADWSGCWRQVRGMTTATGRNVGVVVPSITYAPPVEVLDSMSTGAAAGYAVVEGLADGLVERMVENDLRRDNGISCMVARGWRVLKPDATTAAQLRAGPSGARSNLVGALVGAADPPMAGHLALYRNFALPPGPVR